MKKLFLLLQSLMLTFTIVGCGLFTDEFMDELRQGVASELGEPSVTQATQPSESSSGANDNVPKRSDYSNEQLGLRFTLPNGYTMTAKDEPADVSSGTNAVTEMEVASPSDDTTAYILSYELDGMTDEDVVAMHRTINEEIRFVYDGDFTNKEIAGQSFWHGKSTLSVLGVAVIQEEYIAKRDNTVYVLTVMYLPDTVDERDTIMAGFFEY